MFDINKYSVKQKLDILSKMLEMDSKSIQDTEKPEDIIYVNEEGYYETLEILGGLVVDFAKMKKAFKK